MPREFGFEISKCLRRVSSSNRTLLRTFDNARSIVTFHRHLRRKKIVCYLRLDHRARRRSTVHYKNAKYRKGSQKGEKNFKFKKKLSVSHVRTFMRIIIDKRIANPRTYLRLRLVPYREFAIDIIASTIFITPVFFLCPGERAMQCVPAAAQPGLINPK